MFAISELASKFTRGVRKWRCLMGYILHVLAMRYSTRNRSTQYTDIAVTPDKISS